MTYGKVSLSLKRAFLRGILAFSLLSSVSHAALITCYSGDTIIYNGTGHHIRHDQSMMSFIEDESNMKTYVFAECVAREI